ncbi:type II toxin-antitoxin system PemK/MazF family toxin [Sphingomonas lenta]|uniref:Growth inhibitor PemK n=1 Tax=Sphingomonas lenta TaxID=1141887 RepID=A0A2A2SJ39_9SPHN|nr:type II toxin-antitoxin system PemK/MazF family toxin [Sphingomonas lenta]PAX09304.1 growth inhibitor PemK [Sphingomonas lenta]
MKRGDVVIAAARGQFTGKPRPYVVVQGDWTLELAATVTLCPITTDLFGIGRVRVPVAAAPGTGLQADSEVEIDRITTLRRSNVAQVVGALPDTVMRRINRSLKNWLDL